MQTLASIFLDVEGLQDLDVDNLSANQYASPHHRELRDDVLQGKSLGTLLLARAAAIEGAYIDWLSSSLCVASLPSGEEVLLRSHRCSESVVATHVSHDKHLSSQLLGSSGVPVPVSLAVSKPEDAVLAMNRIGAPVVVKPRRGTKGRGITVGVNSPEAARSAFAVARAYDASVVIEQYIEGDEYRLIGSAERCFSALARVPPHVIGNGVSSIGALIAEKNAVRSRNPHLCNRLISSERSRNYLNARDKALEDVPHEGEFVRLLGVANFSQGADSLECSSVAPREIRATAVAAIAAIPGLPWAAVDIIVSRKTGKPYVLEVNTDGGLGGHAFPSFGEPRDASPENWKVQRKRVLENINSKRRDNHLGDDGLAGPVVNEGTRWANYRNARLSRYLRLHLARLGKKPQRMSDGLYRVRGLSKTHEVTDERGDLWLSGLQTVADKHSVIEAVGRFRLQRRLLERSGVPTVVGSTVHTKEECLQVASPFDEASIVSLRGEWHGRTSLVMKTTSDVDRINWGASKGVWVQERPAGVRVRALADRDAVHTLFVSESSVDALNARLSAMNLRQRIAGIAIDAIRAVPELRWAAVDLVLPSQVGHEGALVEGLTVDPLLPRSLDLIAGSLEGFFEANFPGKDYRPAEG